jgi:membrane associated rhomboid family serine protease
MFLPLKDANPTERFPFVTIALIVANVVVFLYELSLGSNLRPFFVTYGAVPYELTHGGGPSSYLSLVSSMFLHGGFFHVGGNMLYLWIFGNNIEDLLGPAKFLFFYLATGLAAGLVHVLIHPGSTVPVIGASGAVSGVLGAYLLAYPHARVLTLVFIVIFIRIIVLPAGVLLVFWFALQAFSAISAKASGSAGGVAWFAHVGGFIAGVALLMAMTGIRPSWLKRGRDDGEQR